MVFLGGRKKNSNKIWSTGHLSEYRVRFQFSHNEQKVEKEWERRQKLERLSRSQLVSKLIWNFRSVKLVKNDTERRNALFAAA